MAQSRYFGHLYSIRPPMPRYRGGGEGVSGDPFSAGWGIGEKVGGGLAEAYKNAMANKYANQIMNEMDSGQNTTPTDLGNVPGDGGDSSPAPDIGSTAGEEAYVTGEPVSGPGLPTPLPATTATDSDLARGIAAARLQGGNSPSVGSVVHTGGVQELNAMKEGLAIQRDQAALALAQQKAQTPPPVTQIGEGTFRGQTAQKPAKPQKYVPNSGDWENDSTTDDFNQVQADTDAQLGKGTYAQIIQNHNRLLDAKGNYPAPDANGNYVIPLDDKEPGKGRTITVSAGDFNRIIMRYNAARVRNGQAPVGPQPEGLHPETGQPAGSVANPYVPTSNLSIRTLPYGSYMIINGKLVQKNRPKVMPKSSFSGQTASQSDQTSDQTADDTTEE
jgi:hypothetical protein